jgi:hypothetical protein
MKDRSIEPGKADITPTADDAKRYCPCNSKCRGDNQEALFEFDHEVGNCKLDGDKCHFATCGTLNQIVNYNGDVP